MANELLISIIILDVENHHLLPLTIDSILAQRANIYEIIIMSNYVNRELLDLKKLSKMIKILNVSNLTNPEIRNRAIKDATAEYIHFLFPGEYYLSMHSLSLVAEKIEKKNHPDLLCFSFLRRDLFMPSEIRTPSFSKSSLGSERFPIYGKDIFFSKSALMEIGGFDPRYRYLEIFDAITKIYLRKNSHVFCSKRVIVDYELLKVPPKKLISQIKDLMAIIKKEYGFLHLFHLGVLREMRDLLMYMYKDFKYYFMRAD